MNVVCELIEATFIGHGLDAVRQIGVKRMATVVLGLAQNVVH